MRLTCIIEGNLPFSKSTNLNLNLIQNTFTEASRIGPAKLTHKINDHTWRVGFHKLTLGNTALAGLQAIETLVSLNILIN